MATMWWSNIRKVDKNEHSSYKAILKIQSVPASPTIDEKVKVTNSSGDILVNIDGKTSGITTIGINTTDGNIKFDANSNVLITGILTATTLAD